MKWLGIFSVAIVLGFFCMTMWNEVSIVEEAGAVGMLEQPKVRSIFDIETFGAQEEAVLPIDFTRPGLRYAGAGDPSLTEAALTKLYKAGELATKKGWTIHIAGAKRSKKSQEYWHTCYQDYKETGVCACRSCNIASRPSEDAPHVSGKAVDACINGTCSKMRSKYNGEHRKMKAFQVLMAEAGFSRYCREWWHFESEPISPACKPGKY